MTAFLPLIFKTQQQTPFHEDELRARTIEVERGGLRSHMICYQRSRLRDRPFSGP